MGVQSFDGAELRWLGRIHDAGQAEAAFEAAPRGIRQHQPGLHLRAARPGTRNVGAHAGARRGPGAEHLLYGLTVEHGTPLYNDVRLGRQVPPDDDRAADCYELALDRLAQAGYEQYEISNWQRGGHACRHNLVYWRHEPYLGFGAGAHSFDGARRWWNLRPVPEYVARVGDGVSPMRDGETVDARLAMGEFMMLGLRLVAEGVEPARFEARFGARGSTSIDAVFGEEVAGLVRRGLLERLPDRLRLTRAGRLLGNQVFAEFLEGSDP